MVVSLTPSLEGGITCMAWVTPKPLGNDETNDASNPQQSQKGGKCKKSYAPGPKLSSPMVRDA